MRLCKNKRTGVERAVKILRKSKMSEKLREFFLNEVEVLKTIDHPSIVKLYEIYEDKTYYYLVQE